MNCETFGIKVAHEAYAIAEKYYNRKFVIPKIIIKNTKSKAGHYKGRYKSESLISMGYNSENVTKSSFISLRAWRQSHIMISEHWYKIRGRKATRKTIFHEVAHALTYELFGNKVKAHGEEWKRIMRVVFNLKPDRCFVPTLEQMVLSEKRSARRKVASKKPTRAVAVDSRTPEQIQADKDRMAKVRAKRKKKTIPVLPGLLDIIKNKLPKNWFGL